MDKHIKDRTLENLDFIKSVLMVSVVLCHSAMFWGGGWFTTGVSPAVNDYVRGLSKWIQSFSVECFTLVSGYIFYYIRYEIFGYDNFLNFIKKKALRLLLPYLSVAMLWCIPIDLWFHFDVNTEFHKFVLGESPAQLWFLLMLFWVFFFAYYITKLNGAFQLLIVVSMFAIGAVAGAFMPNYFQITTAFIYILFFWTGCMIRKKNVLTEDSKILMGGVIFLTINVALLFISNRLQGDTLSQKGVRFLLFEMSQYAGCLMAFCLLLWVSRKFNCANRFEWMSPLSFPIYLIHQQIIYIVLWCLTSTINPYLGTLVNFVIAVTMSSIFCQFLLRYKYTSLLLTGAYSVKKK